MNTGPWIFQAVLAQCLACRSHCPEAQIESMNASFRTKDAYSYFRMGLVTGIVDKQSLVEWADNEIVRNPEPDRAMFELSLSGSRPHSQTIWLLHEFERGADYSLSLSLLLARAGILLEQDPEQASAIIMGLRLLNEEEYFPKDVRSNIADLRDHLDRYEQASIPFDDLVERLSEFLNKYAHHRGLLCQTVCPPFRVDQR
jgi:hypothetical protein